MSYIRITPQRPDDPHRAYPVMNDRIEFVDDDGKVTDISTGITKWWTEADIGTVRRVRLETFRVEFA